MQTLESCMETSPKMPNISAAVRWYVMRDLKRSNDHSPAYKVLQNENLEVFTPMQWKISTRKGVRKKEYVPFMPDLLFVHASETVLDPFVEDIDTLQYRYVRGKYKEGMVVNDRDMDRFIKAVTTSPKSEYFRPEEITPDRIGCHIRIVGSALDGFEGNLLKVRGSRKRRLLVEIPSLLTAAVEVEPEYIEIIE